MTTGNILTRLRPDLYLVMKNSKQSVAMPFGHLAIKEAHRNMKSALNV